MSEASPTKVYVDVWTLRQRFRELRIVELLLAGYLRAVIDKEYLAPPERGQPSGTLSQILYYFNGDVRVAIVHQYLLPDGTIGASGLPDPKWLLDGERILILEPEKDP